jgi:dTDP-glucose pyrophosphorylase
MDIIIPCAGLSTRFPNMRPKYLLVDYLGRRMVELAASPYVGRFKLHAVVLRQHDERYKVRDLFSNVFGDTMDVIVLPESTSGPAETICKALEHIRLEEGSPFMVHDCDSIFNHGELSTGNHIYVDSLTNHPELRTPANKSYVEINDQGIVISVMEKKIISDMFCVGGYQFRSAREYRSAYDDLSKSSISEIYISSVIDHLISNGSVFTTKQVHGYVDLGTKEDWERFNDKPTIFCDIDGTIVHNQSEYGENGYGTTPMILGSNVETLKRAKAKGCQIIFTTTRKSKWRSVTSKLLGDLGFGDCTLIMDLHHARRVVINDHAPTNPYPSALAINIKRDDDSLDQMLRM